VFSFIGSSIVWRIPPTHRMSFIFDSATKNSSVAPYKLAISLGSEGQGEGCAVVIEGVANIREAVGSGNRLTGGLRGEGEGGWAARHRLIVN
jgi:hypothetical protein